MAHHDYWFVTRPHRKLIRVPKSLAAFSGVAAGMRWNGNAELQMAYENRLEALDLKRPGEHTERARGRGGSGGRTHAQMLYALGLFFFHRDSEESDEEVHLTLAGQSLVDQEDALPVLRKQVLGFQFPSAYSVAKPVDVDRRFRLRPFVLLLRLLSDSRLGGYVTDEEIAACVLGYATRHSARQATAVADRVLDFRARGIESLEGDFADRFGAGKSAEQLIRTTLKDVANTFAQWLRYTGYATESNGVDFGRPDVKTVTALNTDLMHDIEAQVAEWSTKPLLAMNEGTGTAYDASRAAEAYQRTYGVKAGATKDQRQISAVRRTSTNDRTIGLISAALSHLYATTIVTEPTAAVVDAIVTHTGLDREIVRTGVSQLIATPRAGLGQFLDRYQQMAFSGTEEAIAFEKATAEVMRTVFNLEAAHVGQGGRVPDVEVRSASWVGIVDTKAYAAYALESDHQLRMQTSYIPAYQGLHLPLGFFLYIAGGFAPSFTPNLRKISAATGVPGAGIAIHPWLDLIDTYLDSGLDHEDLLRLWTSNREITPADIASLVGDVS
ncbi:hypothetical protein [Microbacterium sp. USHLN186]|uniref:hypothetical protein n=1 Tax=Microbacterium sp. USHLN186 TaxID=3081286 RepID=UPI00301742D5